MNDNETEREMPYWGDHPYVYVLQGHEPRPARSWDEYAQFVSDFNNMCVRQDSLDGELLVSTVFLGLDHSLYAERPVLFETMVFGPTRYHLYQRRYCTWDEAVEGHAETLKMVQDEIAELLAKAGMLIKEVTGNGGSPQKPGVQDSAGSSAASQRGDEPGELQREGSGE